MKTQNLIYHHVFDDPGLGHFTMGNEHPRCYLHYARQGAFSFQYTDHINQLIPEEHFQVYFITAETQTFEFKSAGKSSLLSFSFPLEWLEALRSRFQVMAAFIDAAGSGSSSMLFQNSQPLTAENKRLLNDVFSDSWGSDHIKYMIRLILLPSLKSQHSLQRLPAEDLSTGGNIVFTVAEWLLLHPGEPASVSLLAQKFLVNEFKLKNDFKKHFGMPVMTFQRKARVEKAKQLLRNPEFSVSHVAMAVGFANANYFSDFFRRETGISPSNYKKLTAATETVFSGSRE